MKMSELNCVKEGITALVHSCSGGDIFDVSDVVIHPSAYGLFFFQ